MSPHTDHTPNQVIVCWSPKGGVGTSVFAAVLSLSLARRVSTVLVDAAGDQSAIFGCSNSDVGFDQWSAGGDDVAAEALERLALPISSGLKLVPYGGAGSVGALPGNLVARVRHAFADSTVVIDAGVLRSAADRYCELARDADTAYVVLRPCYLAAQRGLGLGIRRDGIVFVDEPGRVLRAHDLVEVLGSDIVVTFDVDPALARLVDAGRITKRLPRSTKSVERLAEQLVAGEVDHGR